MATVKCPNCGHDVEPGTEFCPNCDFYMTWADETEETEQVADTMRRPDEVPDEPEPEPPPPPLPEPAPDDTIPGVVCRNCSEMNDQTRTYCQRCGEVLAAEPAPVPPPPPPEPRAGPNRWLLIGLGLLAGLVLLVVVIVLVTRDGDDVADPTTTTTTSDATPSTTGESTTSVATDADVAAYVDGIRSIAGSGSVQAAEMALENDHWDCFKKNEDEATADGPPFGLRCPTNGWEQRYAGVAGDEFASTEATFERILAETRNQADAYEATTAPASVNPAGHEAVGDALGRMVSAAEGVLVGLRIPQPDDGSARRESRDLYVAASDALTRAATDLAVDPAGAAGTESRAMASELLTTLSGVSVDRSDPATLYSIQDHDAAAQLTVIDLTSEPIGVEQRPIGGTTESVVDFEGLVVDPAGGFWAVIEGDAAAGDDPPIPRNTLVKISSDLVIEEEIRLPAPLEARQKKQGFEGVAVAGDHVYVAFQRPWDGDPQPGDEVRGCFEGCARIGRYTIGSGNPGEWAFFYYPLDAVSSPTGGWVGLWGLTLAGEDSGQPVLIALERDNKLFEESGVMRLYQFTVPVEALVPDDGSKTGDKVRFVRKHFVSNLLEVAASEGFGFDRLAGVSVIGDAVFVVMDQANDDLTRKRKEAHAKLLSSARRSTGRFWR